MNFLSRHPRLAILTVSIFAASLLSSPYASASYTSPCGGATWRLVKKDGYLYTYRSGKTFCSVLWNTKERFGKKKSLMQVAMRKKGYFIKDQGSYKYFAGPVKMNLSNGQCAQVGGMYGTSLDKNGDIIAGAGPSYRVCNR